MTKYIIVLLLILGGCGTMVDTVSDRASDAPKPRRERKDRSESGGSGSCCG